MNERTCRRWLAKFRTKKLNLKDEGQTKGHPIEFDKELLVASLEESPAVSVEELATILILTTKIFIIIFHNLKIKMFLNLKNGCLTNCLKSIENPKMTSTFNFRKPISLFLNRIVIGV